MKIKINIICCVILCFSCNLSNDKKIKKLGANDTTRIVNSVFNGKEFLASNIAKDTIYILQTKYLNSAWPKKTKNFDFSFLPSNSRTRMFNIGPGFPYDGRERLSIFLFEYKNDTVKVGMYEHEDICFMKPNLG